MSRDTVQTVGLEYHEDQASITVWGCLDRDHVCSVIQKGHQIMAQHTVRSIDFQHIEPAIDSTGVLLILDWIRFARQCGQHPHIKNVPQPWLKLAQLSNLTKHTPIFRDLVVFDDPVGHAHG